MNRPRILQFGATGQVGRELIRHAKAKDVSLFALSRSDVDFTNAVAVRRMVLETPDIDMVVNAVAYTAVDKAETDEALARAVNCEAVGVLARACAERGLPLIHISTDYVYDGEKPAPYVETDRTNPMSAYGRTKLAGEDAIHESGVQHVILRTSWVYSPFGSNFVKTMMRLGAERDELRVVADQHGVPTAAADIAQTILEIAPQLSGQKGASGTFHYTGDGETTWYDFAVSILDLMTGVARKAKVVAIPTSDYPLPARRPQNSRLDCAKIESIFGIKPAPWQSALAEVMGELGQGRAE